jgi:adenylate cyclase
MRRPSLGQFFVATALVVALVVVIASGFFIRRTEASIIRAGEAEQTRVAGSIERRVVRELSLARDVLEAVERAMRTRAVSPDDSTALEAHLFTHVLDGPQIEEVTFTRARRVGFKADGDPELEPDGHWQLAVFRSPAGAIVTRLTRPEGGTFRVLARERGPDAAFAAVPLVPAGEAKDPAAHDTFAVAASKDFRGEAIWSDLLWSEIDQARPENERRAVVTVQKAIDDAEGHFLGVLRVGLDTRELANIAHGEAGERVFILSVTPDHKSVRPVARVSPDDTMRVIDGEVRVVPAGMPAELGALVASPLVANLDPMKPNASGSLTIGGERWVATIRPVLLGRGGTEGWMVAVLVPAARYTAELERVQRSLLGGFALTMFVAFAISLATLVAVRRSLDRIARSTSRMRHFDFAPLAGKSFFADLTDVIVSLERAKTVARAMGKYIPIDLVRRLYAQNEEPALGGELQDVSLLFTDIEGFTTLAEKLPPDELARRLGDYLGTMTDAIEKTGGTIDKYIGDAVMAIWNAPAPVAQHPAKACGAALACMKAVAELYASPKWKGLPALVTRFGLHRAEVMVGHFGAPTRLSYTALGDGVNLAARLEPLCKQYGVVCLASEAVVEDARDAFEFRRIDRVAVKGKTAGIDVFELLGPKGTRPTHAADYERAFEAYLARDFETAIALSEPHASDDPPSAVLLERCRTFRVDPPPPGWNGVHVAKSK